METQIINGRQIRDQILEEVKKEIARISFTPVFCDVLVGNDQVSRQYVNMKARTAEDVGIHFHHAEFSENITTEELIEEIKKINNIENICGLIVQLPLPAHIDKEKVLNTIDSFIDVDCLGYESSKNFYSANTRILFPAALACIEALDSLNLDLVDKKIVVIGQGMLVGKPVTYLLSLRGLNVDIATRELENRDEIIKNADVIISATGDGKFITGDMIKEGAIIIDAGTSESNGAIVGDVDLDSVMGVAGYVSPVPGGVGPITVACLLKNVLSVASARGGQEKNPPEAGK